MKRIIDKNPFVAHDPEMRKRIAKEICAITVSGLAKRMEHTGITNLVLGLSGGIDSTLALLVAAKTCGLLGLSRTHIHAIAMPGFGTKPKTAEHAQKLASLVGVTYEEIDIKTSVRQHFKDIGHDETVQNVVFENTQARERTQILFDRANQLRGLVIGTGDLSEAAAGWCTFNGDHIAHYDVNCDIPKTLVKMLVEEIARSLQQPVLSEMLSEIIDTPYSPDLKIEIQSTDELIGPSELRDFFLYHLVRWGSSSKKILFLAAQAWGGIYTTDEIKKWLIVFLTRFFDAQWKRSVAVDGPKVGSIALSPRGDWRMPSDACVTLWIEDLLDEDEKL